LSVESGATKVAAITPYLNLAVGQINCGTNSARHPSAPRRWRSTPAAIFTYDLGKDGKGCRPDRRKHYIPGERVCVRDQAGRKAKSDRTREI